MDNTTPPRNRRVESPKSATRTPLDRRSAAVVNHPQRPGNPTSIHTKPAALAGPATVADPTSAVFPPNAPAGSNSDDGIRKRLVYGTGEIVQIVDASPRSPPVLDADQNKSHFNGQVRNNNRNDDLPMEAPEFPSYDSPHVPLHRRNRERRRAQTPDSHRDRERETRTREFANCKNKVSMMVKYFKFSGAPEHGLDLYTLKKSLEAACIQQDLPFEEASDVLWHCLEGDAQRFLFEELQGKGLHLSAAFERLTNHFDTPHYQSQAQSYLNSISMDGIRSERSCSDAEALNVANERITNTLPKCGPLCQSDG